MNMSFFNISGVHSPSSRPLIIPSPTSPFCTSPSQLQEVTLDQDNTFSNSMGLRSPGGPMRGRSVKEFEEQLAGLKKENFNLKLRIYFLEERMGVNFNLDKENIVKKNVELMVEVESLRKELQEKHELLCQAVKAMELEDEENKKLLTEKEEQLGECQQEIENLKSQLLDLRTETEISGKNSKLNPAEFFSTQTLNMSENAGAMKELQEKVKSLEEELDHEKEDNAAIQIILDQNDLKIRSLTTQLQEATNKLAFREEEMKDMNFRLDELNGKCQGLQKKLQEKSQFVDELSSENDELRKRQSLYATDFEKQLNKMLQDKVQMIEELSNKNEELRKRQSLVVGDLEKERKRYEKLKTSSEQKNADLQSKLESALIELKKSQELVVSKSPGRSAGNTDADSFSVQKPATSPGSPQKDAFFFSTAPSPVISPVSSPSPSVHFNVDNPVDLKHVIEQLKNERDVQHQKIVKLKAEQMKACKIIKSMIDSRNKTNDEMVALKQKNDELERELEGVVCKLKTESVRGSAVSTSNGDNSSGMPTENSMDEQSGELVEHYKALTSELDEKNRLLVATLEERNKQMMKLQEQYDEMLTNIKQKEDEVVDQDDDETTDGFYVKQLKEKDEEIKRLNTKLLKRNYDLQGLVNNELWEKNREIEKLQKKQQSKMIENKDHEIEKLQNDLKTKEKQLGLIKEKISELGIDIDIQEGGVSIENHLQIELENSEKLRAEANEVCTILSKRLEELAVFLDSLLKQKSVLGFLGNKENRKLRQIIDQSLDLSRTFTMSMIINPDQSLLQLTNISSLLNDTTSKVEEREEDTENSGSQLSLVPSNVSLTYRSHLYKKESEENAQIIQTLRQQIINLKYELQLRDVELNKMNIGSNAENFTEVSSDKEEGDQTKSNLNTTSTTLKYKSDNQSESEAWSEPDRSVSRARMGLLEGSLRSNSSRKTIPNSSTDSTEDEGADPESKSCIKKGIVKECRNTIIELHKQVCELDQKLSEKEIAYFEATKANNKLKQEMANLEIKLCDTETRMHEAENKKTEAEKRVELLQKEKDELVESLDKKDKELQNKINEIEVEKSEALEVAREAEAVAETAKDELKAAEEKMREIQEQMNNLEGNLRSEYENHLTEITKKMCTLEKEYVEKIDEIQHGAELEIRTLQNTIQQLQFEYSENYVKKCKLEDAVAETETLKNEIEIFEERIQDMKEEKEQIQHKLKEYEEKVNVLRSDLDNATLQYSEAVLEKTKLANEKAVLEQELTKSVLKEVDTKKRLDQVANELEEMKQNHQKQVSALQVHKSHLEVRVSELESSNAELRNRLVKIQAGCGDHLSLSLPNTPNFVNQIVSFRRQHSENSGYLSEDHALLHDVAENRSFNRLVSNQNLDIERNEANSSPDLGIESDHGRFSSLETHLNVQRPLLQTLELTESMNNLLDVESNCQPVDCDNAHCCQKTLEMAHENSDLKRKLLRTRRALEETVTQLTLANQRKKQVEKTICRQIHKTSQVLRKAKANLDSGSETDVYKK